MPQICGVDRRPHSGPRGTTSSGVLSVIVAMLRTDRDAGRKMRPAWLALTRDFLEAGDQFVDGLFDRHLLADHAVHRLGPDILIVQDGELVVPGEVERLGAAGELGVDRLAMAVSLPERALLARGRDREPAAERALDIGPKVFFLHQEFDEFLAFRLVL